MEIGAAIAAVFAVLLPLLQLWLSKEPKRIKEDRDAEIQQGRMDLASGAVGAVSTRIDRLSEASSNSTRLGDDADTQRRISSITGK